MKEILIVEDDLAICDLIQMNLELVGYNTKKAYDGNIALEKIKEETFDLIILDVMLPGIGGFEIIKNIDINKIPVIFLTAKTDLKDKLSGLKFGADDYLTKPFEPLELLARIESVLRRYKKNEEVLEFKSIKLYQKQRTIFVDNEEVDLTLKEYELFLYLLKNKKIAVSRTQILEKIWGYDFEGETRTVDMHIQKLRKKLNLQDEIKTVYKIGYRLEE